MKLDVLPSRRDCLYGPNRLNSNPAVRNLLTKDNINVECKATEKNSTYSACFGRKTVKLDRLTAKLGTEIQRKSNFEFGTCIRRPQQTTVSSEFCTKVLPPVQCDIINNSHGETSIPDFSPSIIKDKKIAPGGSVYSSSYHQTHRKCRKSAAAKKINLKQKTKDMQSTHFYLGTSEDSNATETGHSYHSRKLVNSPIKLASVNTTSCVFRKGDWNMVERALMNTTSVSHSDFTEDKKVNLRPGLPRLVNPAVPKVVDPSLLGSDPNPTVSLYQKEFLKYDMTERHRKPIQENPPISSKILSHTPNMLCPKSTKESDFVYRSSEAEKHLKKRMEEFDCNQSKHETSCVVLAEGDQHKDKEDRQVSMTSKDYEPPSNELHRCHKLHRRPAPMYDYIRLDQGISNQAPKCLMRKPRKSKRTPVIKHGSSSSPDACTERSRDSHNTHFSFGLDDVNIITESEQRGQFTPKEPMDSSYPAAGITKTQVELKTHLYAREDITSGDSIGQPSVMKADYNPILKQRMSCAQRRLITNSEKYPLNIATSHYFYLDHTGKAKKSTTTTDYIPPELLLGGGGVKVQDQS